MSASRWSLPGSAAVAASRAQELLETVGLPDKAKAYPAQLSGGQQARRHCPRAGDEPQRFCCATKRPARSTLRLTRQILELIGDINKKLGITVVIITHQMSVVKSVCATMSPFGRRRGGGGRSTFPPSSPRRNPPRAILFSPAARTSRCPIPRRSGRIRLIFRSAKTTSIPLVARLATEENIAGQRHFRQHAEALGGDLRRMLLGVPAAQFDRAWEFLSGSKIFRSR